MKNLALIALLSMAASTSAFAVEIREGSYNPRTQKIELQVSYSGGCEEHKFKLEVGGCLESYPVQCEARLVDMGKPDMCEAYIHETVQIGLKEAGLDSSYYNGASLTITGAGENNSVNIRLPRK